MKEKEYKVVQVVQGMRAKGIAFFVILFFSLLATSCNDERVHITVEPYQIEGLWQKIGTQEFWRYRVDGTGVTWDESEDVSEEESNLTYEWTINGDELTHVFHGSLGNQAVPKVYTVTSISSSQMEWEDIYGQTYVLVKR